MALKDVLDERTTAVALAAWWQRRDPRRANVAVTDFQIPKSSGMSSETVLFRLRWDQGTEAHSEELVARIIAPGGAIFPSHDFELEAQAMDAVRTTTTAPAPEVVAIEHDDTVLGAPFLIMQRLHGKTLSDDPPFTAAGWFTDLAVEQQAALLDNGIAALAEIHRADITRLDPGTLGHPSNGDSPLAQHVRYWEDFHDWACAGRPHPPINSALAWVGDNAPEGETPAGLVWGDARLGNMMFDEHQAVTAVLDWELAAVGPPELDLGWFLFINRMYTDGLGIPTPPGFLDRDATVDRYAEHAGRPVRDPVFYEVFAGVRVASVIMRIGNMMIEMGMMPPDAPMPLVNPASIALANLLELPPPGDGEIGWVSGHR